MSVGGPLSPPADRGALPLHPRKPLAGASVVAGELRCCGRCFISCVCQPRSAFQLTSGCPCRVHAAECVAASARPAASCVSIQRSHVRPTLTQALLELPVPIKPAVAAAQVQRPDEDVFEEARLTMLRMATERGWLAEDGALRCTNNGCWFVTAHKPAA